MYYLTVLLLSCGYTNYIIPLAVNGYIRLCGVLRMDAFQLIILCARSKRVLVAAYNPVADNYILCCCMYIADCSRYENTPSTPHKLINWHTRVTLYIIHEHEHTVVLNHCFVYTDGRNSRERCWPGIPANTPGFTGTNYSKLTVPWPNYDVFQLRTFSWFLLKFQFKEALYLVNNWRFDNYQLYF